MAGAYSGFDTADGNLANYAGRTLLRGYQRTDADGVVEFKALYPGRYPGRTPHVHVTALLGTDRLVTTQLCYWVQRPGALKTPGTTRVCVILRQIAAGAAVRAVAHRRCGRADRPRSLN